MLIRRMLMLALLLRAPDPEGQLGGGGDGGELPAPEKPKKESKPEEEGGAKLAKAYKELKEKSVSKEEYDKLKKENEDLYAQIINGDGGAGNGQNNPPEKVDIKALREDLYGPKSADLSNLDFWKKTLELRSAVIEQEGYDPFLPHGAKIKPNDEDVEKANKVAETVQKCIDEADGNSEVFTALLQAETANDSPTMTAHLRKMGLIK